MKKLFVITLLVFSAKVFGQSPSYVSSLSTLSCQTSPCLSATYNIFSSYTTGGTQAFTFYPTTGMFALTSGLGIGGPAVFPGGTTANLVEVTDKSNPQFILNASNAAADEKVSRFITRGAGSGSDYLQLQFLNDSYTGETNVFQVSRTGVTPTLFAFNVAVSTPSLTVAGQNVCQANGTNCPASGYSLGGALTTANVALGSGAGTGATFSVDGLDGNFFIEVVAGTSPSGGGTIATITFTATRGHNAYCTISSLGGGLFTLDTSIAPLNSAGTAMGITDVGAHIASGDTYGWNVSCP